MKNSRIVFIRWTAVLVVIAIAIYSVLLSLRIKSAERTDINVPPQPSYVTSVNRQRPEINIERLLNLDDPKGFDSDLTSLLTRERERQRATENPNAVSYEPVASVSHDQKGDRNQ